MTDQPDAVESIQKNGEPTDATTIDFKTVDWRRVSRASFQVRIHYRYTYTAPVTDLRQRLIVIPPDRHGDQEVLDHSLELRGDLGSQTVQWEQDQFGNRICRLTITSVSESIDFEATYCIERVLETEPSNHSAQRFNEIEAMFLRHTALTAPDDRLRQVARDIALTGESQADQVLRALEWTANAITYQFGVTNVQTPAAMALYLGKGVCQDYAHILIALLRLLGIAARYVSGHLPGDGPPHAWVEVFLSDPLEPGRTRVMALDPSIGRAAELRYLTVAVGRDFADVSPTTGFFSGPAVGRLSSSKQARLVALTRLPAT